VLRVVTTEEEAQLHARQVTWVYSSSISPFQSSLSLSWESRPGCKIDKLTSAPSSASAVHLRTDGSAPFASPPILIALAKQASYVIVNFLSPTNLWRRREWVERQATA
jgi:hypothetical protein